MSDDKSSAVTKVGSVLLDPSRPLKERFRALFALRGLGGAGAVAQMAQVLRRDKSALLKHEVAYCLGQMGDGEALEVLREVLADTKQEAIVRHEAGEALGAIVRHSL